MNKPGANTRLRALTGLCLGVACCSAVASDGDPDPADGMVTPSLVYDGGAVGVLQGGQRTGSTYSDILHLRLQATAPATSAWAGTSALVDVRTIHSGHLSARVGDAQGVSNIQGPTGTDIEELWVQHNFQGANLSLLAGIYDLNTEFYRLQAAGLFLNSSFGIGPEFAQSGLEGPSIFPRTSAGVRLAYKPAPGVVLRAALLDGVPVVRPDGSRGAFRSGDGLLGVAEAAFLSRPGQTAEEHANARRQLGRFSSLPPYQDKLAIGLWRYSARFADIGAPDPAQSGIPAARHGSSGGYVVGEWRLIGRGESAGRMLSAFGQFGTASSETNRFATYVGTGLVAIGWFPGRESDQIGLSVASARNGSDYLRSQVSQGSLATRAETTIELSYLTQLTKWLTLQPDVQYVIHPNTSRSLSNAWVLQLRFEISFQ